MKHFDSNKVLEPLRKMVSDTHPSQKAVYEYFVKQAGKSESSNTSKSKKSAGSKS
jgi:hypothetical protein